jgi:hypothetical protein
VILVFEWAKTVHAVDCVGSVIRFQSCLVVANNFVEESRSSETEFLATEPEVPGSIPGATKFS